MAKMPCLVEHLEQPEVELDTGGNLDRLAVFPPWLEALLSYCRDRPQS